MRFLIFTLVISVIVLCLTACGGKKTAIPSESYDESSTQAEHEASVDEKFKEAAKIYPFLKSKYTVSAQKTVHGISYLYDYYFVRGTLAGIKQTVVFDDVTSAEIYYQQVLKKCEQAIIDETIVTHFLVDDSNLYGCTLEKLKFTLETTEYEYTVNFDEEAFNSNFSTPIKE